MDFGGLQPVGGPGGVFGYDPNQGFDQAAKPVLDDLNNIIQLHHNWRTGTYGPPWDQVRATAIYINDVSNAVNKLNGDFAHLKSWADQNGPSNPHALEDFSALNVFVEKNIFNPTDSKGRPLSQYPVEMGVYYCKVDFANAVKSTVSQLQNIEHEW